MEQAVQTEKKPYLARLGNVALHLRAVRDAIKALKVQEERLVEKLLRYYEKTGQRQLIVEGVARVNFVPKQPTAISYWRAIESIPREHFTDSRVTMPREDFERAFYMLNGFDQKALLHKLGVSTLHDLMAYFEVPAGTPYVSVYVEPLRSPMGTELALVPAARLQRFVNGYQALGRAVAGIFRADRKRDLKTYKK